MRMMEKKQYTHINIHIGCVEVHLQLEGTYLYTLSSGATSFCLSLEPDCGQYSKNMLCSIRLCIIMADENVIQLCFVIHCGSVPEPPVDTKLVSVVSQICGYRISGLWGMTCIQLLNNKNVITGLWKRVNVLVIVRVYFFGFVLSQMSFFGKNKECKKWWSFFYSNGIGL